MFAEAQLVVERGRWLPGRRRARRPLAPGRPGRAPLHRTPRGLRHLRGDSRAGRAELCRRLGGRERRRACWATQAYATVSGDLSLTRLGGSASVNSVSGDVTMRADQPISVKADTVSGDLSVVAPVIRSLRANAVSGDIDLEGQLAMGEPYRIDTVSGDLSIALVGGAVFEVRGISSDVSSDLDHRIEGYQDRRRVTVGAGGPEILFNSMSGDLAIHRPRRLDRVPAPPPAPAPPAAPAPPRRPRRISSRSCRRSSAARSTSRRPRAG